MKSLMKMNNFFVIDTNNLISASLIPTSTSRKALEKAMNLGKIAIAPNTQDELLDVIFRKKLDKYFSDNNERLVIVNILEANAVFFSPEISIDECKDKKDNKFLELAIAAQASCIITGDNDLLVLHSFRNIPILNAFNFINTF
ncbi:putative toxin-antitoxin system toxin component, PIN family [Ferruginibacter sp.]|uniref:putative toxin-antitoxin system toxin component, PIN family n=1 Tax=Ferruginibacter sp. TaxID=1940288 RepID=UPI0019A4206D|nr:putative toxin-antitoxin system toxin component, PIN family [Ferruginibacter sp.]MBC7625776.1 putative toxin-antitoxin system toxin component, PIN family [Ferruginibacter sp.]